MPNALQIPVRSLDPRLKRHINHDPASARYPVYTRGLEIADVEWSFHLPTQDQGDVGKCTAEAAQSCLVSDAFWSTLVDQASIALPTWTDSFYSDEETLDGDGPYPPQDNGSSGLTSAKVAKARGLISGYLHAFSADDALKAIQIAPLTWGTLWKTGMDDVDAATGQVRYTGSVRGGHEIAPYKVEAASERMWFRNSWGASWGHGGNAWISFDDFAASLADQGDVTQYVPLTDPHPTPVPSPAPSEGPSAADRTLAVTLATRAPNWTTSRHVGANRTAANAVAEWLKETGL